MNTKNLFIVAVVCLILGFLAGRYLVPGNLPNLPPGGKFSGVSTTTYNTAVSQLPLYNWQFSVAQELANLRSPLSGITVATTTYAPPALGFVGQTSSTTSTDITVTGAALGDFVVTSYGTSTGSIVTSGYVSSSSVVKVVLLNASTSASVSSTATTSLITVWDFGANTLVKALPATQVTTTTTP